MESEFQKLEQLIDQLGDEGDQSVPNIEDILDLYNQLEELKEMLNIDDLINQVEDMKNQLMEKIKKIGTFREDIEDSTNRHITKLKLMISEIEEARRSIPFKFPLDYESKDNRDNSTNTEPLIIEDDVNGDGNKDDEAVNPVNVNQPYGKSLSFIVVIVLLIIIAVVLFVFYKIFIVNPQKVSIFTPQPYFGTRR